MTDTNQPQHYKHAECDKAILEGRLDDSCPGCHAWPNQPQDELADEVLRETAYLFAAYFGNDLPKYHSERARLRKLITSRPSPHAPVSDEPTQELVALIARVFAMSKHHKGMDAVRSAINTLRSQDYQRGRTDEAKTCEKAGKHDYGHAIAVAELRGRVDELKKIHNCIEDTVMFLTNDLPGLLEQDRVFEIRKQHKAELHRNLDDRIAQLEGKQEGKNDE